SPSAARRRRASRRWPIRRDRTACKPSVAVGTLVGGDENPALVHQPFEQLRHVVPDHVRGRAVLAPDGHLRAEPSGTSRPTDQIIREQTELVPPLPPFENGVPIGIHV